MLDSHSLRLNAGKESAAKNAKIAERERKTGGLSSTLARSKADVEVRPPTDGFSHEAKFQNETEDSWLKHCFPQASFIFTNSFMHSGSKTPSERMIMEFRERYRSFRRWLGVPMKTA